MPRLAAVGHTNEHELAVAAAAAPEETLPWPAAIVPVNRLKLKRVGQHPVHPKEIPKKEKIRSLFPLKGRLLILIMVSPYLHRIFHVKQLYRNSLGNPSARFICINV